MAPRAIDRRRSSAGSMLIGSSDEGAIIAGVQIGERTLAVKQRAVYELMLADSIDPEQLNPDIPNSQRRLLSRGSDSALVSRVLLTAESLLKAKFLAPGIDCDAALSDALEATIDLAAIADEQEALEREISAKAVDVSPFSPTSGFSIPHVEMLEPRLSAACQRGHHAVGHTMDLARRFYGSGIKHPDSVASVAQQVHGENPASDWFDAMIAPMRFAWELRNVVEHPKPDRRLISSDFSLLPTGNLRVPMVEVVHPQHARDSIEVTQFLATMVEELSVSFERLLAFLCAQHLRPVDERGRFETIVGELPPDMRTANVRFSHCLSIGGKLVPTS